MKSINNTVPIALAAILSSFIASPAAQAVITNHSGTICKNYNASEAVKIDYLTSGARSYKSTSTQVLCPLTRNASSGNGAKVYVDIKHSSRHTTSCTAYSYDLEGKFLASATKSWTGSGFHEFVLNLRGNGKSNSWSDYSVLCTIPGSQGGMILGVDLSE